MHHHSSHAPNVRCRMSHLLFLQLPSPPDEWQMCLSYWIERTSLQCYPCCYTWTATSWATAKRLAHDHRQLTAGWRSDHNGERCEHTGKMRLFLNWIASLETDHMLISVVHEVKFALNMFRIQHSFTVQTFHICMMYQPDGNFADKSSHPDTDAYLL